MSPSKPKSICAHANCHKKVNGTYCDAHQKERKSYGYSSDLDPWYQLKLWRGNPNKPLGKRGGLRERQLLSQPYCEKCKKEKGIYNDVTSSGKGVADHIQRFREPDDIDEQWRLFTDIDNLETLCRSCHASKSASESNKT